MNYSIHNVDYHDLKQLLQNSHRFWMELVS